jgi:aspartate carbamoyltransferase catalytic subunit
VHLLNLARPIDALLLTPFWKKKQTMHRWQRKDLIALEDLSLQELEIIYDTTEAIEKHLAGSTQRRLPGLQGKTVVNLFLEPSTRTRLAFEVAAQRMSATTATIIGEGSSLAKGESLQDTVRNIEALHADMIILRHRAAGSAAYVAERVKIPVINGGDGAHEHPTQGLLDTYTLRKRLKGSLKGKRVTILGDILFSRVARSNLWALTKQGAIVTLGGPPTLVPKAFEGFADNIRVEHDLEKALGGANAVMLLRIQHERQTTTHFPSLSEYKRFYGLSVHRESLLEPDCVIMHPGPINRGVELDSELADDPRRSVILDQVRSGVMVRMACMFLCHSYVDKHMAPVLA